MQSYTTVFFFIEKATSVIGLHALIIIAGLVITILVGRIFFQDLRQHNPGDRRYVALIPVAGLFVLLHTIELCLFLVDYIPLSQAYTNGHTQVSEGQVRILSIQPDTGHAEEDRIVIGKMPFVINHWGSSPGYTDTIAYHGILTEGQKVRVISYNGVILRIDLPSSREGL